MSRLPTPRLLPVTICAMGLVLGVKCVGLAGVAAAGEARAEDASASASVPARLPPAARVGSAALAQPSPTAATATAPLAQPSGRDAARNAPGVPATTTPDQATGADVRRRRAEIEAQEARLQQRQSVIAAAAQKLDQRVAELKALQVKLESDQAARAQAEDRHWDSLVALYEKMKPRDAARILEGMDTPVVVALIGRMKELRAAPIMAAMSPDRARDVTAGLAGRHPDQAGAAPN